MSKHRFGVSRTSVTGYFQGEMMTCAHCGKQLKSDPNVDSNWTVAVIDGKAVYFCPVCFWKVRKAHR